jgi:hypothetical protein
MLKAITTFRKLDPNAAVNVSASSKMGNARKISRIAEITRSNQLPKYPASNPNVIPTRPPIKVALSETISATLEP